MKEEKSKIVLGLMLLFLFISLTSCESLAITGDDIPMLLPERPVDFMTEMAIKKDIQEMLEVDGRVYSKSSQNLAFKKSGKLSYYDVYVGKEVAKGDVLASIDISNIEYKITLGELRLEKEKVRLSAAKRASNPYSIRESEIAIEIEETELEELYNHLQSSTLVSGIDEIISSVSKKNIGSSVSPNKNLISIIDINDIGVQFTVNDRHLAQIKLGDTINLSTNDRIFETEIYHISGNTVTATLPEDLSRMKVTAKIKIQKVLQEVKDAILVPKVGIFAGADGNYKVQVLHDNKIDIRNVKLGIELDDYYQIIDGIEEGEQIIVK